MKRSIAILLLLAMMLGVFAGCGKTAVEPTEAPTVATDAPTEATVPADAKENLAAAAEYLKTYYKDALTLTGRDYTRIGAVRVGLDQYPITWSVNVSEDIIKIVVNDDGSVTIDIADGIKEETPYVLTATLTDAYGNVETVDFEYAIPASLGTMQEIVDMAYALETGKALEVEATLTGEIISVNTPYDAGYKNVTVTIKVAEREDYPIMCYRLKGEGADTITVGDTITVTGILKNYNGTIEFDAGCKLEEVIKGDFVFEVPSDPKEVVDMAYALGVGESMPVKVTLTGKITDFDKVYDPAYDNSSPWMVVEGRENKPILCYRLKGEGVADLAVGDTITVTGTITNYNGKIEFAQGCTFTDRISGGGTPPAPPTSNFWSTIVEPGKTYYMYMNIAGVNYYFSGNTTSKYLPSSTNVADAVEVTVEAAEDQYGVRFTFTENGTKYYIEAYESGFSDKGDGKGSLRIVTEPTIAFYYNGEAHTYVVYGTGTNAYFMGTYGTYTTFSCSSTYYITGANAPNAGVTQYIANFMDPADAPEAPEEPEEPETPVSTLTFVDEPVVGTAYKFAMQQNGISGKPTLGITGEMSGYYFATSETVSEMVDVYLEEAEGGYHIYFMNGETKTYLDVIPRETDATKTNVVFRTSGEHSVYTLNTEFKYVVTTVNGTDWYLGTYGTNKTFSASKTSYISDTTTIGVSQFCGWFGTPAEGGSTEPEQPENPENPEVPATLAEQIAQANGLAKGEYLPYTSTITGTITDTPQASSYTAGAYKFTVSDGTNTLLCYYVPVTGGTPAQGDKVTVTGKLTAYNNVAQFDETATATLDKGTEPEQPEQPEQPEEPSVPTDKVTNGAKVVIYNPANNMALSSTMIGNYSKGIAITITDGVMTGYGETEIFTVTINDDGTYTFTNGGKNFGMQDSYASTSMGSKNDKWQVTDLGNGLYLIKNVVRGNYLEWYAAKNNWSTYTNSSAATDPLYQQAFYIVEAGSAEPEEPACKHTNTKVEGAKEATCTVPGHTGKTVCVDCGETIDAGTEIPVIAHNYVDGKCECGATDPNYTPAASNEADFDGIVLPSSKPNGDSSYTATYTTPNGWVTKNSAIQCGGAVDMNPQFTVIGPDNSHKAVCMNGKTSAPGSITSPTLTGGISKLTMKYTKMFTDTKLSATITITDLATGAVYTNTAAIEWDKNTKYEIETFEWTLDTPITGDFTIVVVNDCPTAQNSNKDRMTVLELSWEPAVAAHEHNYEATTTATCTADGITTYTCECGDSYTEETAKLGHIDENLDIDCDREGCTSKVAPPADSLLSNFTANCLGSKVSTSNQYYVQGTIVEVLDAKSGIFLIDDGTGETFYFRLPVNADGVSHASWAIKLTLGDKVKVYGKIYKYSTSSAPNGQYWPAIQGGVVTLLEQHPHDYTFSPADCRNPAACACGQTYGAPRGCVDADANDICDDCGKNTTYTYEYIEIRTDNNSGVVDTTAGTYTWNSENFGVQVVKASGSQLYTTAKDHMRVYKNNQFVLMNKNGLEVKTIIVYLTNATQVTNFEKMLTGYTYTKNEVDFTVTVVVDSAETITFTNSGSTTQIKGVEFGYDKKGTADKAAAEEVIALIDAIGEVTLEKEEAIVAARAAYEALTDDQKALVTNLETLTAAEAALEELKKPAVPTDPIEIVNAAYALAEGESLPYTATLTGKIVLVDTPYSTQYSNITVTIEVEGTKDMPIKCYRMKGTDADTLNVNDIITVTGTIKNYYGTIEFDTGCTLDAVVQMDPPAEGGGAEAEGVLLATFTFPKGTSTTWTDGNGFTSKTYTDGSYTLNITNGVKVYNGGWDPKGVGFIKFGTGSAVGTLTFTVPENVDSVVLHLAKYKSNASVYTINGGSAVALTKNGNDSQYDEIVIDTSVNKTITLATGTSGKRMVMYAVLFYGTEQ